MTSETSSSSPSPPRYAPHGAFFTMGAAILHDEQREFFIPLAGAVFITSETSSSSPSEPPFFVPGVRPPPLGIRFMSPCAPRTASRLPGFACVMCYMYRGQAPCLLYAAPAGAPIQPRLPPRGASSLFIVHCTLFIVPRFSDGGGEPQVLPTRVCLASL